MPTLIESNVFPRLGLRYPLIVAPMAGGPSSPELVAAASGAGALGSAGSAYSTPAQIEEFAAQIRQGTDRPFAINLFVPRAAPRVEPGIVERAVAATAKYRVQFEAVLRARPAVFSFVFGLRTTEHMRAARKAGMLLIGTATTPEEAQLLEESGADAITLQGFEAGGHRGIFDPEAPELSSQ